MQINKGIINLGEPILVQGLTICDVSGNLAGICFLSLTIDNRGNEEIMYRSTPSKDDFGHGKGLSLLL